jgi:UDP-N-acetylmuramoylalanine-D-glutamate ligase
MKEAVKFAYEHTSKWKVCLLSTASPSFSCRKGFEEKWDLFQQYVIEFWKE